MAKTKPKSIASYFLRAYPLVLIRSNINKAALILLMITPQVFATPTTIPLIFTKGKESVIPGVYISLNHQKTIAVKLDSGDFINGLSLSSEALQHINYRPLHKRHCVNSTGGQYCYNKITIPTVTLGGINLEQVPGQIMNTIWGGGGSVTQYHDPATRNGSLGFNVLKDYNIMINYHAKQLILFKEDQRPDQLSLKTWNKAPFTLQHGITIHAVINGKAKTLVLDSGAIYSTLKHTESLNMQPCSSRLLQASKRQLHLKTCYRYQPKNFIVNDANIHGVNFMVLPVNLPFDGLLGSDFFRQYQIFIDFKHQFLYFKSTNNYS